MLSLYRGHSIQKQRFSSLVLHLAACYLICSLYFFVYGIFSMLTSIGQGKIVQMSNLTCFYLYIPVVLSANIGHCIVLAMSVDQLISVCWPFFYISLSNTYIKYFMIISWTIGLINLVLGEIFHKIKFFR